MDIFGDDIDSMLDGGEDDINKNIREVNMDDDDEKENGENDEKKAASPIPIEHKKRSVRNPQLRLNVERLKCERGIQTLENYFKGITYLGRGHERHDLNIAMKRIEHWAHRLYPSFNFDDFLGTCEKLGRKKQIQTHMYRYRQDMLESVEGISDKEENEETRNETDNAMEPIDELDEILDQQIQNYTIAPPKTPTHDQTFDSIRSSVVTTPHFVGGRLLEASTPLSYSNDLGVRLLPETPSRIVPSKARQPSKLSSEQMARIAENRKLAQERLNAKREREKQMQQKKDDEAQTQQSDAEMEV